jgi:hypothetical protein
MTQWLSIKKCLPLQGTIVLVRWCRFSVPKEAMFIKEYFVHEGENITAWVNHWQPLILDTIMDG